MRPVLILPIADLAVFTQAISPVVPSLGTGYPIGFAVLLMTFGDEGQDTSFKILKRFEQLSDGGFEIRQHENIQDTYEDMSVYGVIAQIVQRKKWAK